MIRKCLIVFALLIVTDRTSAQEVKYEKYQLSNGMTVILHEDHSLPVACINTWFYVGSKDEAPGRSGFAHLFEHLMFMGTRRVPGNAFDVLMETEGGFNNASTSEDRTNYFSFGPSSLLPTLLWLDADRLEDLGKEMTKEKLDKQREVVRNERRQTSEMRPYGRADLKIGELMYPPEHPYHHTVIGSHEDLEAATVRDVTDFFAAYYVPNNASLVVAGDFDPKIIMPLIEKLFGTLPRAAQPAHKTAEPITLSEVRRVTYTDSVQFPRTTMVYHSPAHFAPGDAEMDLAAAVLSDGISSRLYQRLIYTDKLATAVEANQQSSLLGSLFTIEVTARQEVSLDKVEAATDEVIAEFLAQGPTAEELERQKAKIEYATITGLQSLLNKADSLNEYNFAFGEPDGFKRDLDRYRQATTDGVRDWARKVLTQDARLIMRVLPEKTAVELTTARDKRPETAAAAAFTPQAPQSFTLSNGIPVRHWKKSELPLVSVLLQIDGGAMEDSPAQSGRAFLTASMLDEGAGPLGAIEFADALDKLGADFSASAGQETTSVRLSVLKRNLDQGLALFSDAVLRPRFEEKEWDREKRLHLEGLKRAEDRPQQVAGRVGLRAFYGDDHPYGRPAEGTVDTVENLSVEALKACHAELLIPSRATLFIAGDLTADEAKASLEKVLADWKNDSSARSAARPPRQALPPPANSALRVVVVDKPDAVQTVIRFFMPGPTYASPDRIKLELFNTILGGSFTSRLNQNLREDHGYTYGARCGYTMTPRTGYFSAGCDVQAEHTGAALAEFLKEFKKIRGGDVSDEEAGKARETNRMELIQSFEGLNGILSQAALLEQNGLPFSTLGDDLAAISNQSAGGLNKLASAAVPLEQALLVLVGKKSLIEEQIKKLPFPTPTELTARGEPVTAPTQGTN
ncbi:MAG TPA: pitrilysin family protein [Phycisphaerae bacterium]|nr:pitrilysin family protein [Phycisphaerae bacterium]